MDDGWNARIWTGSANATEAAFHNNVEMLVELTGRKKRIGVQKFLQETITELLDEWHTPVEVPEPPDEIGKRLEETLLHSRRELANADLDITIRAAEQSDQYKLVIDGPWPALDATVTGQIWPIGLTHEQARPITGTAIEYEALTLEAVSAFVAVELTANESGQRQQSRFVLRLPTNGMPDDRGSRLLSQMLANPEAFMRLLMILLADDGVEALFNGAIDGSATQTSTWWPGSDDAPVLESLLQSLDRSPERIDRIQNLIDDLSASGRPDELLPKGFMALWDAIQANRDHAQSNA